MADDEGRPIPPELWTIEDGVLHLRSVRCTNCGTVAFPPQFHGCEACGAHGESLTPTTIPARGTVHSFTTVHRDAKLETPFVVGEIVTAAATPVRARLSVDEPGIGMAVIGRIAAVDGRDTIEFVAGPDNQTGSGH